MAADATIPVRSDARVQEDHRYSPAIHEIHEALVAFDRATNLVLDGYTEETDPKRRAPEMDDVSEILGVLVVCRKHARKVTGTLERLGGAR